MIIDGHAHYCGHYLKEQSLFSELRSNQCEYILLCPGTQNDHKDYDYPMLSEQFPHFESIYWMNKGISLLARRGKLVETLDEENDKVFELAQAHPRHILQAYWLNPLKEDYLEKLEAAWQAYHFKCVKLHQCWTPFDALDVKIKKITEWAIAHDLPIFIHLKNKRQVQNFIKLTNMYLEAKFIVAHMIGVKTIGVDSQNKNVYFDLSSPQLVLKEDLEVALRTVGPGRMTLGSDTPFGKNNLAINLKRIDALALTEEERGWIKGENLAKLLKLSSE